MGDVTNNVFEILALLISLALISMLVVRSSQTTEVLKGGAESFATLLDAATLNAGGQVSSYSRRYG